MGYSGPLTYHRGVPLSEREQQILDEIEQHLRQEDPRFARSGEGAGTSGVKTGVVLFIAGFASLIAFFVSQILLIGVVAFAAMVAGIVLVTGGIHSMIVGRKRRNPSIRARARAAITRFEQRVRARYKRI